MGICALRSHSHSPSTYVPLSQTFSSFIFLSPARSVNQPSQLPVHIYSNYGYYMSFHTKWMARFNHWENLSTGRISLADVFQDHLKVGLQYSHSSFSACTHIPFWPICQLNFAFFPPLSSGHKGIPLPVQPYGWTDGEVLVHKRQMIWMSRLPAGIAYLRSWSCSYPILDVLLLFY